MKKIVLISLFALLAVMLVSSMAVALPNEGTGDKTSPATSCGDCHAGSTYRTSGPHGGYTDSTDKCQTCHDLHASGSGFGNGADNEVLLMGETVTDACQFCHNLTSSEFAPYNMTNGAVPASGHRVLGITFGGTVESLVYGLNGNELIIPGGATDGGDGTLNISDQGKLSGATFTCDSCHTPHGVNTVTAYLGESVTKWKSGTGEYSDGIERLYMTNRLLKSKPNAAAGPIATYGSAWCAACHQGRTGTPTGHTNHPVDLTKPAYQFLESGVANDPVAASSAITSVGDAVYFNVTQYGSDPRTNKQYAMAEKNEVMGNVSFADGYVPIANYVGGPTCQQCHASARDVTQAFAADLNPARGSFPHVSTTSKLLVQDGVQDGSDKFCANCHAPSQLP